MHVARADNESHPLLLEPVRHRRVALHAVGELVERERRGGFRLRRRAPAPARRARFDATAATGSPASISACRFVPSPLTSTLIIDDPADHEVVPRLRDDRAVADTEVEDAPQLVLLDVAREPIEAPAAAPKRPSRARRGGPPGPHG